MLTPFPSPPSNRTMQMSSDPKLDRSRQAIAPPICIPLREVRRRPVPLSRPRTTLRRAHRHPHAVRQALTSYCSVRSPTASEDAKSNQSRHAGLIKFLICRRKASDSVLEKYILHPSQMKNIGTSGQRPGMRRSGYQPAHLRVCRNSKLEFDRGSHSQAAVRCLDLDHDQQIRDEGLAPPSPSFATVWDHIRNRYLRRGSASGADYMILETSSQLSVRYRTRSASCGVSSENFLAIAIPCGPAARAA